MINEAVSIQEQFSQENSEYGNDSDNESQSVSCRDLESPDNKGPNVSQPGSCEKKNVTSIVFGLEPSNLPS
jgi:hypothetical protein